MLIYQGLLAVTIGLQPGYKGLQGVTRGYKILSLRSRSKGYWKVET